MIRLGITGTDTTVGKTVVTAALTAWLRQRNINAVAMKPVETGGTTEDADLLREAGGNTATLDETCPLRFSQPLAPLAAAEDSGIIIDPEKLDGRFKSLSANRDAVLVEGAGGILVPIALGFSYATLFRRWDLDLVIVAANRLGVINHTMLTISAARASGLRVAAIVLNDLPAPAAGDVSRPSNRRIIEKLAENIPVISFPTIVRPRDISLLASQAEASGLGRLILERCGH